ncbi:hypothetical protein JOE59_001207 [Agromyces cerinus]|uniref:hypothetical protein n=1 Tax=Agromyces cerinus TaxID=33878 RepID=UPI001957F75F|nr:hypothetical protein [Agromyces cerinus]MBM7830502.1 hypothetical protein [Agromyces cerinus]
MDAPSRSSNMIDATPRMSRLQSGILWFVLVAGTFGGLLIAANVAFGSQPVGDRTEYAYHLAALDPDVRALPVVAHIPESALDIRLVWNPATGAAAAAWNTPADAVPPEGCAAVAAPAPPVFAERIVRLGAEPPDGLDCSGVIVVEHGGATYAWTAPH